MGFVITIAALAALVWGAFVVQRISLVACATAFVVVGYVFGFDFWNAHVGPLPLTLDRIVLAGLVAAFAAQWRLGQVQLRALTAADWLLGGVIGLLAASAILAGPPDVAGAASPWGRLGTAFVIPALVYLIVRQSPLARREWLAVLGCFAALGVYLSVTAILEVSGQWSLVFPHYISDPSLGIHFGRARGPGLNAASLGMYLTACGCCAWLLIGEVSARFHKLALAATLPLVVLAVFFTYTRSTWFGLAAAGLVIAAFQIPRRWRLPSLAAVGIVGLLAVAISWNHLVGLKREGTAAESEHSVDQRESFTYVSWQMFKDHPVFGVGFGRFYDRKLPYLSDRSQPFELESIRPLHHHNTFLGMLTETGLVGLVAFIALLAAWARSAWQLATLPADGASRAVRAQGVLMLALLANYVASAVFHDLTLVPTQHWLLFVFAAVTINLNQQTVKQKTLSRSPRQLSIAAGVESIAFRPERSGNLKSHSLFGLTISNITMPQAVRQVLDWCHGPRGGACRFVVTPNVDHVVMFQHQADLRAAYADAALTLADGAPIVLASRLLAGLRRGDALPERVAGSDLVPKLFAAASEAQPLRVFLLGAAPGVGNAAAGQIKKNWPNVQIVGTYSPPLGFEKSPIENSRILKHVASAAPDLLIVGFGAPKQELWVHANQHALAAKVAICAGATIDFLAGEKRRAPRWMQSAGLEWAHRVLTEPRRLAVRYARDAWLFPRLLWQEVTRSV